MGRLKGKKVYLCGAMDRVKDAGLGWRRKLTPLLQEMGLKIYDPGDKPTDTGREDSPEYWAWKRKLKKDGKFDELRAIMKEIRHIDLRMVDESAFIIVCLDMTQHPCGTYEELFCANRAKKPVLIMCPQGVEEIPDWLFGTLPHQLFFNSFQDILTYLNKVDSAPISQVETYGRWVFFKEL